MIPSNTICVSQEGPANALALNKDCTQVVIAGRNVFKVFSIGENEFSEVCNLRVGKNLNLNFSSIDVAWSSIEENTLATAATNGAVVVWNLGRSGRSKQEHVFSDHKRTVNKVSFHLTDPALLISGSQDGMMKCFDLRMKEVARTFISNTESIRDVQFSPQPAHAHAFAAVSENGSVQVWDARRHERPLHQFTAHSGPVFACDWHPDLPWLATASRDKTIKVWDIHAKPNLEHTIYTIASVGHVKWRPQRRFQVASCALVLDCAVHVWDVRRPHVPLATFAEHRDVTTAIAWQASPAAFLSTSRDCSLYRHRFSEAAHPVLWANPQGVCVSARGQLAHAAPDRPLPALLPTPPERLVPGLPRKQPTAGSLGAAAQAALESAFAGGAASTLARHWPARRESPVVACAREYRVRGRAPHLLAAHNARVAAKHDRHMVAHVWNVVQLVYARGANDEPETYGGARAPAPPPPAPPPRPAPLPAAPLYRCARDGRGGGGAAGGGGGVGGGARAPPQRRAGPAHAHHLHPARQVRQAGRRERGLGVGGVRALRGRGGGRLDAARGGVPAARARAAGARRRARAPARARRPRRRPRPRPRPPRLGGRRRVPGRLQRLVVAVVGLGARAAVAAARRRGGGRRRRGGRGRGGARRGGGARLPRRGGAAGQRAAPARRPGRHADRRRRVPRAAGPQERAVPVHRREPAGAVAAGLHRAAAAPQALQRSHRGGAVRVAELRVDAVAAVQLGDGVLRALRAPHAAARRLRPLRAAPGARPVRRVPPGGARAVRLVPGLLARRPPAPHAPLDAGAPAVPGRLRPPLPALVTRRGRRGIGDW